jgi:hypothetical protein
VSGAAVGDFPERLFWLRWREPSETQDRISGAAPLRKEPSSTARKSGRIYRTSAGYLASIAAVLGTKLTATGLKCRNAGVCWSAGYRQPGSFNAFIGRAYKCLWRTGQLARLPIRRDLAKTALGIIISTAALVILWAEAFWHL